MRILFEKKTISLLILLLAFSIHLSAGVEAGPGGHPRIYISDSGKEAFTSKLQTAAWAKESYEKLKANVDPYVDRHQTDPEWIISRLQMYWDTHYERVYVKGGFYSHGTGHAPVPTVKFAGARDWQTDYVMPSLEETQPYMDSKGIYLQNVKKEGRPWEWVHPSKTGRIIGSMNDRILALAADAAFLYWYTKEEKYAVFASDIFITYVKGINYRREPFALEDYTNSHLMGLATFEVILDHVIPYMAVCYDFLYSRLKTKGEDLGMIQHVLKRFAEQQIMYGVPDNNWNIFQARHVTYLALALEDDGSYEDHRGRQYYIDQIFNHTTIRQFALTETMDLFDKETAMWPESATYSMSVCKDMLDIICLIDNAENNHLLDSFPIMKRAVPATVQYVFPDGRVTAFGDAKYVPLKTQPFEMLIALFRKYRETGNEKALTQVLQKMINDKLYDRSEEKNMFSLFFYVDKLMPVSPAEATYNHLVTPSFYIPNVSLLMQRNGNDPVDGMAFSLVGAYGNHAHANGISLEMFGKGLMLAPESSFGVSYGSRDNQEYYARFPAHNTVVVDGQSDYGMMRSNDPFELLSCYPASADTSSAFGDITYANTGFTEPRTEARQERLTSMIRTGKSSGYVVDIFRSKRTDGNDKKHEYFYHSIGQQVDVMNTSGAPLDLQPTEELSSGRGDMKGYDYFTDKKSITYDRDFKATFNIMKEPGKSVFVNMWMKGYPGRTVFSVLSPPSNAFVKGGIPDTLLGKPLPTLIIRQEGEAWNRPFVTVYNPYSSGEKASVESVEFFDVQDNSTGMAVVSPGRTDYIFSSADEKELRYKDMNFSGCYAVVSEKKQQLHGLFLGNGSFVEKGNWRIESGGNPGMACLIRQPGGFELNTSVGIKLTVPGKSLRLLNSLTGEKYTGSINPDGTVSVTVPPGKYKVMVK